jgi:hypothetical protein
MREAAWHVVLIMTQATAMDAISDASLCGAQAFTQLSSSALQQLAGHLAASCGGLPGAVQALVLHGEPPSSPCRRYAGRLPLLAS